MSKPAKTSSKPLTREQAMDIAARKAFAKMDAVNSDKSIEYRIMNERDLTNPLGPQPSERNRSSQAAFSNADLTFSQVGEAQFGNSNFMRSRRRF